MTDPPRIPIDAGTVNAVVDPTSRLLREVEPLESRFPWTAIAVAVLGGLWLFSMPQLRIPPMSAAETGWVAEALHPAEASPGGSALARALTRATWSWQGIEIEGGRPLSANQRLGARLPAAAAGAVSLLVFFVLARLVAGGAAALLAACLLAITPAWIQAGTSALPLVVGEMMVLFGVTWAIVLHGRNREVEIVAHNALRIGIAGAFLGIGLLLAPATFASFVTTLLLWFVLGLRRSNSDATTLPVGSPKRTVVLAVTGSFVLVGATVLAVQIAERLAGATAPGMPPLAAFAPDATLWSDLHRRLLSPGPRTDVVLLAALGIIAVARGMEHWGGRPWRSVGLVPWIYLAAHIYFAGSERAASAGPIPELSLTVAPLFMLGLGWTILRGMQPGRVRRQEYGFALTWLCTSVLLAPFVAVGHPHDPDLAASVSLLPPALLIAGRGARALWESVDKPIARTAVLAIAYLPVAIFALHSAATLAGGSGAVESAMSWLGRWMPWILVGLAGAGALSEMVSVRPEARLQTEESPHRRGRRGRRGGRGGRGGRHGAPGRRRREAGSRT